MVKNPPANAGDTGDGVSILESGRCPGGGNGNLIQCLAWRIPWTEESGRLHSPWGHKESDTTEHESTP